MICNCPNSGALPTVTPSNCPFDLGQIQRIIVCKTGQPMTGSSSSSLSLVSTWTSYKSASDASKLVGLPVVFNPEFTPGDENITGENSNETPNGEGIKLGEWGATLTGNFSQQSPDVISAMKELECWKGIGIYLVNQDNRIFGRGDTTHTGAQTGTTAEMSPIPIGRFSVKDYDGAALDAPTKNDFTIKFTQMWWKNLTWVDSDGDMVNDF